MTLTLREYQPCNINLPLDLEQREVLNKSHIAVTAPSVEGSTWTLTPSSYIGTVRLDNLSIIVRPKISIDRVMFLVAYAIDPKDWRSYFDLSPAPDVLESIIPAFIHHTRQAVRRGLLQGYRHEEEALHTVRGRIRFGEQLKRRNNIILPIEVAYDEFTEDIEENRLIKTALHRLARLPVRSATCRRDIHALRPVFNAVGLGGYHHGAPVIRYNRINDHYRPAVELARLIVDNSILELYQGAVSGASFLLDMNAVFERFLFVALGEVLELSKSEWLRGKSLTLDQAGAIKLEPDLSWWRRGHCRFVGDAKYKRLDPEGFRHPDIYQMLAYCTAVDLPAGLLAYAHGEAESGVHQIKNAGKSIEVVTLNLNGCPEAILKEVRRIAERVYALACMVQA